MDLTPRQLQTAAKQGFDRLRRYRAANAMFVKEYTGQYYSAISGETGQSPINLIYSLLRTVIPNLVMKEPQNKVTTRYPQNKQYAELLSLALDDLALELRLKQILRGWIVSAYFSLGIMKTGIKASGQMINFGDVNVDAGQVYTDVVDLDDFTFDPNCRSFDKAAFLGSRVTVPRKYLLDNDIYDNTVVMQLPAAYENPASTEGIAGLTRQLKQTEMDTIEDYVSVVELWIPGANTLVTIPDPTQITLDKYVGITEYYGPKEGPYTFLSFTPPVAGNPLPVSPIAMMYDLHKMSNDLMVKLMEQSGRQKDITLYTPASADEMQDIEEAVDGDKVAVNDPSAFNTISFGGQNDTNTAMLGQIQSWANYMAANPDQMSGMQSTANSATQAQILENNASISMEDAKGIIYDATADITRKIAWFLHTDPLIDLPLVKRRTGQEDEYLRLTPEQRSGDFIDFKFRIKPRSMTTIDPILRSKRIMEFATNIIPGGANAAMIMMQMGQQFNLPAYLTLIAEETGIGDEVQGLFQDPDFMQKLMIYDALGSKDTGKAEQTSQTSAGATQNKGNPTARPVASADKEKRQGAQATAAASQSATKNSR